MSLDISLYGEPFYEKCICSCCYNEHVRTVRPELYSDNITHNLNHMAEAAGIYQHLWRPEEISITKASQLIEPLRAGLTLLESEPERFRRYNANNGWGTYENLVPFVQRYLAACEKHPNADVSADR